MIIVLAGIILFVSFSARQNSIKNVSLGITANTALLVENMKVNLGLPIRIKIPSISVNANIEQVSTTLDGAMDVPKEPQDVAWFALGPRPGEIGNAVIDGHSGYKDNKPAVFDNLNKLQKGDKIYVEDKFGVTTSFVVRELRSYNPKADTSSVFSSDDGGIHLNLITCTGTWNETERTHSDRLVVFADKE